LTSGSGAILDPRPGSLPGPESRARDGSSARSVGSTGSATPMIAFGFLGRRRRDGELPATDEVLQTDAARGEVPVDGEVVPPVAPPVDPEALLPRWRRPSLLEARKADPRSAEQREIVPMSFATGAATAVDGLERRLIRYTLVDLLDTPDELRSTRIGAVSQGDEVQLLERSGSYWLVLCPDGGQGWIHRMTLGGVVTTPLEPPPTDPPATGSDDPPPERETRPRLADAHVRPA
jgi:hypothetical protein